MKELITKVEKILDQYFGDNVNNRVNQWSWRTLKQVVLGEIANYKIDGKPIEPTKEKIIRK